MLDMAMRQAAVGAAIRRAREEKGWKQRQLAAQIPGRDGSINSQTVSNWERGVHEPDIETLEVIAAALGKPISYFLAEGEATLADQSALETLRLTALSQEAAAEAIVGASERMIVAADRLLEAAERLESSAAHIQRGRVRRA